MISNAASVILENNETLAEAFERHITEFDGAFTDACHVDFDGDRRLLVATMSSEGLCTVTISKSDADDLFAELKVMAAIGWRRLEHEMAEMSSLGLFKAASKAAQLPAGYALSVSYFDEAGVNRSENPVLPSHYECGF